MIARVRASRYLSTSIGTFPGVARARLSDVVGHRASRVGGLEHIGMRVVGAVEVAGADGVGGAMARGGRQEVRGPGKRRRSWMLRWRTTGVASQKTKPMGWVMVVGTTVLLRLRRIWTWSCKRRIKGSIEQARPALHGMRSGLVICEREDARN